MNEFCKPKTFRDRKKHPSKEQQRQDKADRLGELVHPKQEPYKRDKARIAVEDEIDWYPYSLGDEPEYVEDPWDLLMNDE